MDPLGQQVPVALEVGAVEHGGQEGQGPREPRGGATGPSRARRPPPLSAPNKFAGAQSSRRHPVRGGSIYFLY